MSHDAYRIENSRIQYYNRPATGYQIILLIPGEGTGPYWTLFTVIEYRSATSGLEGALLRDGSRYSYPAASEAKARQLAVEYAMTSIVNHWSRSAGTEDRTRMDVRIYPFGGLVSDMRLVPRR